VLKETKEHLQASPEIRREDADFDGIRPTRRSLARGTGLVVALWLMLTGLAMPFDRQMTAWLAAATQRGATLHSVLRSAEHWGDWWVFVVLGLVLLIHPQRKRLLIGYAAAGISLGVTIHLAKFIVGRARPEKHLGTLCFRFFGDPHQAFDSFPSGHESAAVLLATLLALYWPRTLWLTVPAAVLVGISRVGLQRHYFSDVVGGAGLTLVVVFIWVNLLGRAYYPRLWKSPPDLTSIHSSTTR
jgi:membrane-associated phospholipid phosphatase